jgi:hypothetical protein
MTEIKAIESGQKDALLRRANIKKKTILIWYRRQQPPGLIIESLISMSNS